MTTSVDARPVAAVVIPTCRRTESFKRAVESVFNQQGVAAHAPVELILADNDPSGSALSTARALEASAPAWLRVQVLHEPRPGVANVRNTALSAVSARHVFFLDDDQSAPENWLAAFLQGHLHLGAPVSFGPILTALPSPSTRFPGYMIDFFARKGPAESQIIEDVFGCGNAALDLDQIPFKRPLFDLRANEFGGEDDILFRRLKRENADFAWIADAEVFEHVPVSRATPSYTLRRAYTYGQGASHNPLRQNPALFPITLFQMGMGVIQALGCAGLGALYRVQKSEKSIWWFDKAARGVGKVFWPPVFKLKLYGAAAARRASSSAPQPADGSAPAP